MISIGVHLDTLAGPLAAGTAEVSRTRGLTATRFRYRTSYLSGPGWDLSPDLPVTAGEAVTEGLPGALDDSAPDMWGRDLITRRLARVAAAAGQAAPTPTEVDFLLGVSDLTRQGAIRLSVDDRFVAEPHEVPRLIDLEQLIDAATAVADGRTDTDTAVELLLDAGSGSLGGARPKASVIDDGTLFIAKFAHPEDRWDVMRWESVTLELAGACGLSVPPHRLELIGTAPVVMVQRFDRRDGNRVPFLSGRSLAGSGDGGGDYLELVEAITNHGSDVDADLVELWRRVAFSILVNNTDDHLRNHGFLRARGGWKLSPLFDVNPNANPRASRVTSIAGETSPTRCPHALFAVSGRFGLEQSEADQHWAELVEVVGRWRDLATEAGIAQDEHDRFAPVLDRWRGQASPAVDLTGNT